MSDLSDGSDSSDGSGGWCRSQKILLGAFGGEWHNEGVSVKIDLQLFVYGSLVPGGEYWGRFCEGKVVARKRARVWGKLFKSRDGYLALAEERLTFKAQRLTFNAENAKKPPEADEMRKEGGEDADLNVERSPAWIPGWVLTLRDEAALWAIDGLEGYAEGRAEGENDYQRVRVKFFAEDTEGAESEEAGEAWCYVMMAGQLVRAVAVGI